jgi:polyisoprenoid-binding protein YceI
MGMANSFGQFKAVSGTFVVDEAAPEKCTFDISVKVESIDSANPARDGHLKSPDFFNAKQFPTITFKSRKVTKSQDGYEVTGDLTLHGVKKELVFKLDKIATGKDPRGGMRAGFSADVPIKRSDYGMKTALEMIGDDVMLEIGIEGARK